MASGRLRRRRKGEQFLVPVNQGPKKWNPAKLPHYWHPEREGVIHPPKAFQEQLARFDPDVRACYSPVHERWLIWVKNPRVGRSKVAQMYCPGWSLLFTWEHSRTKEYMELDIGLLLGNLYMISRQRWGDGMSYFDNIMKRAEAAEQAQQKDITNDRHDEQKEFRDSFKISSAGKGNKFALHHDGTMVPSQGEQNWRHETRRMRLSAAHLRQEKDDAEKAFY